MNRYLVHADIAEIIALKPPPPTTVMWNRLEGRPHSKEYGRALRAEVRDPLWLLTRQWQIGEFLGDDAASPVTAKIAWSVDTLNGLYTDSGAFEEFTAQVPIEAVVEARPVPLNRATHIHNADIRMALGQRWEKMLRAHSKEPLIADFRDSYRFEAPDAALEGDYPITSSAPTWQTLQAIAGRLTDGGALFVHLASGAAASDGLSLSNPTEKAEVDALGTDFAAWAANRYFGTADAFDAWRSRHLEYAVGLSAPAGESKAALAAREYRGGRMDWYHFDAVASGNSDRQGAPSQIQAASFVPTQAQFDGMANTRYWAFEEGMVNFGDIHPDKNDLSKLLLIEFGLVYSNDWFVLPMDLPVGSLTEIRGLAVTNVFGERHWIEPAVSASGPTQSWQMFRLTDKGRSDPRLFLPAVSPLMQESEAVEAVDFVRDEVANMVWGIEKTVQMADGMSRPGREVALELSTRYAAAAVQPAPVENEAKVVYRLMSSVAENWIPFIPVHISDDNREVQLQRAAMPRLIAGGPLPPAKIRPRTGFLREGLDQEALAPYYVAEEEVERAGTNLTASWQRCRWTNGEVLLWLAYRRSTGRGEAGSGLAFDFLESKTVSNSQ